MCAYVGQGEGGGSVMNFYDLYMSWLILLLYPLYQGDSIHTIRRTTI